MKQDERRREERTNRSWRERSRRNQLAIAGTAGLIVGVGLEVVLPWQLASLLGWDVAAFLFLVRTWLALWHLGADEVERVATREDPSRGSADLMLLLASVACIVGVGFDLIRAANAHGPQVAGLLATAVGSLLASWLVVHTLFTLRYASLYYTGTNGGVDFNQDELPDYGDFAYLAFTIGMTFQVSDTDIQDHDIRRAALRHALLSYMFGAVLLAMTINVGASLLK